MTFLIHILRRLVELSLAPFDALPEFVALTLLSVITGVLLLLVVRWTTPQRFVDKARNRMTSAVYETRLFLNDPGRLVKAQGRLLVWSVLYVGSMLPAFALVAVPMGLYFAHMDGRYGRAPLSSLEPVVLRADLAAGANANHVSLLVPPGVTVAAGPVVLGDAAQVYWRLEVASPGVHELSLRLGDETVSKRLVASANAPVSESRSAGLAGLLDQTTEAPLPAQSAFDRITMPHPERTDTWLGMAWWLYWMLLATVAALALRKPLGVAI